MILSSIHSWKNDKYIFGSSLKLFCSKHSVMISILFFLCQENIIYCALLEGKNIKIYHFSFNHIFSLLQLNYTWLNMRVTTTTKWIHFMQSSLKHLLSLSRKWDFRFIAPHSAFTCRFFMEENIQTIYKNVTII